MPLLPTIWSSTLSPQTSSTLDIKFCSAMILEVSELDLMQLNLKASFARIKVQGDDRHCVETTPLPDTTEIHCGSAELKSHKLVVRASSYLDVQAFNKAHVMVLQNLIPLGDAIAGFQGRNTISYTMVDQNQRQLGKLRMKLSIPQAPKMLEYKHVPDVNNLNNFTDTQSRQVATTLKQYLIFQSLYYGRMSELAWRFICSTFSIFWKVTDELGPDRRSASGHHGGVAVGSSSRTKMPSNPLQDIMSQMNDLLMSLRKDDFVIPREHQYLVDAVVSELCRCVGFLEEAIQTYRETTWESICLNGKSMRCEERQRNLFYLRYQTCLFIHKGIRYTGIYHLNEIVQDLLEFSQEEDLKRKIARDLEPLTYQERLQRPFTTALASPRGKQCDYVWDAIVRVLHGQAERGASWRDVCRRALLRLVQGADRIPPGLQAYVSKVDSLCAGGAFGKVYRGTLRGGADVAIKIPQSILAAYDDIQARRELYLEIITWKTVDHPRLLPFIGVTVTEATRTLGPLGLVSPFMGRGTLRSFCSRPQSAATIIQYMHQIVDGMIYLHEEGLVHGDLRASNVFLADDGDVRIADFGLSVFAEGFSRNYFSMRNGNVRWVAPEILRPDIYNPEAVIPKIRQPDGTVTSARPTKESDVYTFACLCIELYTGQVPFDGLADNVVANIIIRPRKSRPPRPQNTADKVWKLMTRCWDDEAVNRPDFLAVKKALEKL